MNSGAFLLAALRNDQPQIHTLLPLMTAADWHHTAHLVKYHQVAPLLWHRLRDCALPPAIAADWRTQFYTTALANAARLDELAAICSDLAEHGIVPVVLKGMALAPTVYPNLGMRAMGDVDVLVARADLAVTWAVLSARGYLLVANAPRYWREQFRTGGELRLHNVHHQNTLEVHWWLWAGAWARFVGMLHDQTALQRAVPFAPNPTIARRLHPHDEVLHVAFHAVVNNQCGAGLGRMLADLDHLIRSTVLDWQAIFAQARRWRLGTVLWFALSLLDYTFATPLPADWHSLAPSRVRRASLLALLPPQQLINGLDPRLNPVRHYGLLALLLDC